MSCLHFLQVGVFVANLICKKLILLRSFWFHVQNDNAASTQDSGCKTLEKSDPEILPSQQMLESSKVHLYIPLRCLSVQHNVSCLVSSTYSRSSFSQVGVSNQISVGNMTSGFDSNFKKLMPDESNKISSSTMVERPLISKTLDTKQGRRLKRKHLKYHLGSLHLSSNILFKTSLSLCKKKKHRRKKCGSAVSKCPTGGSLFSIDDMSSDFGPSTSEKSKSVYLVSTCKPRKKSKHGSRDSKGNSARKGDLKVELLTDIVDKESGKRSTEASSAPATMNQMNCSTDSIIVANHNDSTEAICPKDRKRSVNQDGLHRVHTNGFQNTVGKQLPRCSCISFLLCFRSGNIFSLMLVLNRF